MANEKLKGKLWEMVKATAEEVAKDPYGTIENALDIVLEVGVNPLCELRGWRVYTTFGGPTIYVTPTEVVGVWGGERVEYPLPSEVSNRIWITIEQMFPTPTDY